MRLWVKSVLCDNTDIDCRKRYLVCTSCTKSTGELPCPKRSTGTFWSFSKSAPLKGGAFVVAPPRNAFAFLTPCSVFLKQVDFAVNFVYYCGTATRGSPPSTPPPLKRWTKLLPLCLFVQLFSFCCFFNKLKRLMCLACISRFLCQKRDISIFADISDALFCLLIKSSAVSGHKFFQKLLRFGNIHFPNGFQR